MQNVWILVCDAGKARFFETHNGEPSWRVLEVTTHEESRSKADALVSDHAGRRSSEGGSVHHNALAPSSSPKENQKEQFARTLASVLDRGARTELFAKWVLVAPPHFVGVLVAAVTKQVGKRLMATVEKDLNELDVRALEERLRDVVHVPVDEVSVPRDPSRHHH